MSSSETGGRFVHAELPIEIGFRRRQPVIPRKYGVRD